MEHESFTNLDISKYLNENFISIKIDREERPDLYVPFHNFTFTHLIIGKKRDRIYMMFLLATNQGRGGWPMSIFLTPDLHPFCEFYIFCI